MGPTWIVSISCFNYEFTVSESGSGQCLGHPAPASYPFIISMAIITAIIMPNFGFVIWNIALQVIRLFLLMIWYRELVRIQHTQQSFFKHFIRISPSSRESVFFRQLNEIKIKIEDIDSYIHRGGNRGLVLLYLSVNFKYMRKFF